MNLGINDNPSIRTYAYQAYMDAILENNLLLRVLIKDATLRKWKVISSETDIVWEGEYLNIYSCDSRQGKGNTETCIYTEFYKTQELIIKMEQFINFNENAIINFFVCFGHAADFLSNHEIGYRLGVTRYGLYIKHNEEIISIDANEMYDFVGDWNTVKWFKLNIEEGTINSFISKDGNDWIQIDCMQNEEIINYNMIGINTNFLGLGEEYSNWLYMNFIHLNLNKKETSGVFLNYYDMPYNGMINERNIAPHFLESRKDLYLEIIEVYGDFKKYLCHQLRHSYYVIITFDEFYVPEHRRYNKQHFYHPILVYGYDDEKNEFLVLDYNRKLFKTRVYSDLFTINNNVKKNCAIMSYRLVSNISSERMRFDVSVVIKNLKKYLNSCSCEEDYGFYLPALQGKYGISIWNELVDDKDMRKQLLRDVRMSYLLCEHNLIMCRRIEFLGLKGYLNDDKVASLKEICRNIEKRLETLKNSILKNMYMISRQIERKKIDKLVRRIIEMLKSIQCLEMQLYSELLKGLEGGI